MAKGSSQDLLNLLFDLQHSAEAQPQFIPDKDLEARLAMLRQWQTRRLTYTYADLLENTQYRAACQFFLNDIYAPRDFSQRDHHAEHLYTLLKRYLPKSMLRLLADAIRLNQLTNNLDHRLLQALFDDLGVTHQIAPQTYAAGYRICDNYSARKEQIDLLIHILDEAAHGARRLIFGISLYTARVPAYHAGWFDLYDFLDRGYTACKPMKNIDIFVSTIHRREMSILQSIYPARPIPFADLPLTISQIPDKLTRRGRSEQLRTSLPKLQASFIARDFRKIPCRRMSPLV